MSEPVLRTQGLRVGYRTSTVLEELDLALRPGELVALLGANGAGKSTLLRTLAGLQKSLDGTIELLGEELEALSPRQRARRLGVVLPERSGVGLLSVFELVALGRQPFTDWTGRLRDEDVHRVHWALEQTGLEGFAKRQVGQLSDGEQQKVMIARALAQEPNVLILDEPTAFLDLPGRVDVLALLRRLAHDGLREERAVLLSTHDLDLALRTADRLWLVDQGQVRVGTPEDLALDGALARAFSGRSVVFDDDQGSFRLAGEDRAEIVLEAEGRADLWTRRALRRAGFKVCDVPVAGALAKVSVEAVVANEYRWRVSGAGEARNVEEMLRLLRDLEEAVSPASS